MCHRRACHRSSRPKPFVPQDDNSCGRCSACRRHPPAEGGAGWAANSCALMTFCPESLSTMRSQRSESSSLCKSAAVRRPPIPAQRNQIDYAFRCPKLRAVKNSAAANENLVLQAVDATDVVKPTTKLASVAITSVIHPYSRLRSDSLSARNRGLRFRRLPIGNRNPYSAKRLTAIGNR
jgi:hypothetical protein